MEGHLLSPTAMERHWIRATYIPSSSWRKGSYLSVLTRGLLCEKVSQAELELLVTGSSWQVLNGFWDTHWWRNTTNTFLRKGLLFILLALAREGSSFPEPTVMLGWVLSSKDFECRRAHILMPQGGTVTGRVFFPSVGGGAEAVFFTWSSPTHRVGFLIGPLFFPSLPVNLLPVCPCHSRT